MKRALITIIAAIMILTATAAPASAATTDKGLVKSYCTKTFKGYKVRYVKEGSKAIFHRTGKKIVYVETVKTTACGGKIGRTRDGYMIKYNKKAKKGHKITVYLVYSPRSNEPDDIAAIVTQKKIRK